MKRIVAGVVAHVDAGKTTLSEALLYAAGATRRLGRVDHGDAFLDTNAIERARGITIFTEPAIIDVDDLELTLLDTPGHVDFSAETERTLQVLDYAVLVVSAVDGIQGHTQTLFRLLGQYGVPTFVFINKTDAAGADERRVLAQLQRRFGDGCIDFTPVPGADGGMTLSDESMEAVAMQSERAMDEYLDAGAVGDGLIRELVAARRVFPVYCGAALRMQGVDDFLRGFARFVRQPRYPQDFGARVFKISHDAQGNRLSWMKVTGGELRAKMVLPAKDGGVGEKIDQVRSVSGATSTTTTLAQAGTVCAVSGPEHTFPGEGFGIESDAGDPTLQPVLTYTLLPGRHDIHKCLLALRELEDEEPLLHVVWQERLQEAHVQLMGAVQLEVVEQLMHDRFGLDVGFGAGSILYKETIAAPVEGVGHFEPLRHYAEVHLLLEPLDEGAGLEFVSDVDENELDRNWRRLILQHLREREHLGVLVGAPITDMRVSLIAGRGHLKHTEGGDFRQATYRALRMGLMEARAGVPTDCTELDVARRFAGGARDDAAADGGTDAEEAEAGAAEERGARIEGVGNCRLLEPWYRFRLELPQESLGRAMSDVQRMCGESDAPQVDDGYAVLEGVAPVSGMRDYAMEVNAYSHGRGRLSLTFAGYRRCHDEAAVVAAAGYDPEADLEHTPDSVFCAHGAGYPVKWYKVPEFCHVAMREE
ncbi:GTP-binding protein [Bifidobacterium italicum]|uniref:GTP-binding protein n=1 Tax=Bifidobacterium italicum TaxID=1960968 RepID=A0A2A2EF36_9BIFI|nr:TetM/TetW/TetO/TetS family tetracycline resistance ribosomal protection protein [Bifidobacterium italicum]PAU67552.1 GTP-binding protein [Bifidobacterium italicum]